jgi:class III poly(R)-hydroxyalkanoic acid synthase PhaC subunit
MSEIGSNLGYPNSNSMKNIFPVYYNNVFGNAMLNSLQFNIELSSAFSEAYFTYCDIISEYHKSWNNLPDLETILKKRFRNIFDKKFREEQFVETLSNTVASYSEVAKVLGTGLVYQGFSNISSTLNNEIIEPIRDTLCRTPSKKVCRIENYSLFHYNNDDDISSGVATSHITNLDKKENKPTNQTKERTPPVLVIYAFINRHYILDLLPEVSVIRNLLYQGLDIFATDWGTPSSYDKKQNLDHFINTYLNKSVDYIRKITKSDKVSLFGYCWGGNLALMYSSLYPEKIKNIVTVATPGDFDLDNSLLSVWTRSVKEEYILDAFGNMPGMMLNTAFNLRRPMEYSHKYFHFFERPHDLESIVEFFATESWLYDSPPVIGKIYEEFVEYCYKKNLLIKNKMMIEKDEVNINRTDYNNKVAINLKNITAPFLNIVAQKDDLVAPQSSKSLNVALTESHDKNLIEFNSGHVGLMIGKQAHKELWPKVGQWIIMH